MKENSVIDWKSYGALLYMARIKNGFSRGKALAEEVEKITGLHVSERTIYALEDASRSPSADIFIALQQVLPELRNPDYLKPIFKKNNITVAIINLVD